MRSHVIFALGSCKIDAKKGQTTSLWRTKVLCRTFGSIFQPPIHPYLTDCLKSDAPKDAPRFADNYEADGANIFTGVEFWNLAGMLLRDSSGKTEMKNVPRATVSVRKKETVQCNHRDDSEKSGATPGSRLPGTVLGVLRCGRRRFWM